MANSSDFEIMMAGLKSFVVKNQSDSCDVVPVDDPRRNLIFSSAVYIMYTTVFVVSLFGNIMTCYILLRSPKLITVTNLFMINLAIGDVITSLMYIPFKPVAFMLRYWPFWTFWCAVVDYICQLSISVSAYTLVAISIDRYIIVMYPLKRRMSKRVASFILGAVWIFAGVTVLPSAIFSKLAQPSKVYSKCDKYICVIDFSPVGKDNLSTYVLIRMMLQYVIPLIVLVFTYSIIGVSIWRHRMPGEAQKNRDDRVAKSKHKMVKMMVMVVFVFTLCWLPFNLLRYFQRAIPMKLKGYWFFAIDWLAVSHTCYNPIIYLCMNRQFRNDFKRILNTLCMKRCFTREPDRSSSVHSNTTETETSV